jgi:hypothetical protein
VSDTVHVLFNFNIVNFWSHCTFFHFNVIHPNKLHPLEINFEITVLINLVFVLVGVAVCSTLRSFAGRCSAGCTFPISTTYCCHVLHVFVATC